MNNIKKRIWFSAILWIAALLLFPFQAPAAEGGDALKKVSLQLQWKHQFEFAGFYAAKEKGRNQIVFVTLD